MKLKDIIDYIEQKLDENGTPKGTFWRILKRHVHCNSIADKVRRLAAYQNKCVGIQDEDWNDLIKVVLNMRNKKEH